MAHTAPPSLQAFAAEFDRVFPRYLPPTAPLELSEAVRYSALTPGKRLRPYLVVRCCELAGGRRTDAWPAAAAIECVHAFSLVHDDLPAMDNDDMRRGQPTTHRKFGDALAILAGDALVVLAFEILAGQVTERALAADLALELARQTGWTGMIGGQAADVLGQSSPPSLELGKYIHERKTACLFKAACRMGGMAGKGTQELIEALGRFGACLGRAYQIADDLLDVTSTGPQLGKAAGKDALAGKQTYPRCVGVEASRVEMNALVESAIRELATCGPPAEDLRTLARYVASRDY